MHSARSFPKAAITSKQARTALTSLLYGCVEQRLAGFTAASLASSYNVPLAECERMLAEARARRRV